MEETNGEVSKKRKNRWGAAPVVENEENEQTDNPDNNIVSRKSRWSTSATANVEEQPANNFLSMYSGMMAIQPMIPQVNLPPSQEVIQQTVVLKLQLQQINEKLMTVTRDALVIEQDPNRSPSPPPKYDSSGKRTNTREVRMREEFTKERVRIIEELLSLNPTFQAPTDFIKTKPVRRIYIPKQTNPLYNFIGLIIGPRGNTQKQMEQETGTRISIRGKGSAKEGSKGRSIKVIDEDEELHVHITGETEANVDRAAKMIEEILTPNEDNLAEHKQKQLRELALINGTLREDEYCPVCGEKGHRQFECPHRAKSFKAAGVKCSICGDLSHPTRDCPFKQNAPTNEVILDSEYDSFMAELGDGPTRTVTSSSNTTTTDSNYNDMVGNSNIMRPTTLTKSSSSGGPVYVTPIVELVSKKAQTVIHVTSVMTGNAPPVFLSSMPLPGTITTANTITTTNTVLPNYPSSVPISNNNMNSYTLPPVDNNNYDSSIYPNYGGVPIMPTIPLSYQPPPPPPPPK